MSDTDGGGKKWDLPTPTSAGALETPITPASAISTANGNLESIEEEEYRTKTGWAPRFGSGKTTKDEDDSLIDQTTWLEEKLSDQFYGDWYHNAAVIVFACLSSWVIAVLGGGLGWVALVMAGCGTYYRTSIRRVRRNFRDDVHREMQMRRLEHDTESLEWINSFLVKFWPIYQPVLAKTIISSVDAVLSSTTPAFLDSLRLSEFTLGTKPPRLEHVKTYPKMEDDIVVMDWKFSFTPNDTQDMTARQIKERINPKVVLEIRIGKGMISKAMGVIVENFAFSGIARIKFKLQIPFPHIEKVEFCFLEKPDIDYECKPIGGEHFGFDINFIPGLEGFIKEQIHGNIGPIMYAPNVFPIEIAKMLAGNAVDQAIGVVAVTLHGAQGLRNPDSGTPDPYTILTLNDRDELGRSKTVKNNGNPRWNETKYLIITSLTDTLTMQVWDYNEYRKDKQLGTASFALERLDEFVEHENLQLEVVNNGKPRGILQADVRFFPVLTAQKREDGTEEPVPVSNTGIARLVMDQAKELDSSVSMVGRLSPYAIMLLNNQEIHRTREYKRVNEPVFDDCSKEFLVTDRANARIGIIIKDERDLSTNPQIGAFQIKFDDLMRMMEHGKDWFNLAGVKSGRVHLRLEWKPIALRGIEGSTGGYVNPVGVMRLHFQSARGLKNVETMGKSDPYMRVLVQGVEKAKTVTIRNNLNPDWDEVLYVPVHSNREQVTLECMDFQTVGKDRSLGYIEMALSDYIQENDEGEYVVHDTKKIQSLPLKMLKGGEKGTLNFTASFFPTVAVVDPDEEEAARRDLEEAEKSGQPRAVSRSHSRTASKASTVASSAAEKRLSTGSVTTPKSLENTNGRMSLEQSVLLKEADKAVKPDVAASKALADSELENEAGRAPEVPKIRLTPETLEQHSAGIIVFRLISAELSRTNVHLEVLMDDYLFPAFHSSKAKSLRYEFGETGDAVVRELDMSRITLRLMERSDSKGGGDAEEHAIAKLSGDTLQVLQSCLYEPRELVLKGNDNSMSKVKVSMKYLPIRMALDPSESMNNMGTLRVDVLDAADLPSADRNGYSDPYCKFELNGESVYKTKVQKKTLHPAWNEFFEANITSRTAANFVVNCYDWDFGDKADHLGKASIDLRQLKPMESQEVHLPLDGKSGVLRLRLLFRSAYVQRSRQGSSTFSGTIGPAGKIIGAPVKGVGKVGSGVIKGATFLGGKLRSNSGRQSTDASAASSTTLQPAASLGSFEDKTIPVIEHPGQEAAATREFEAANGSSSGAAQLPPFTPVAQLPPFTPVPKSRSASIASTNRFSTPGESKGENGFANVAVVSATGFPAGTKLQVTVKTTTGKSHTIKTKGVKAPNGEATFSEDATARIQCSADQQFQVKVVNDKMIGHDDLGEAMFFVDDSGHGSERSVKVGNGQVVIRSSFAAAFADRAGEDSPANKRKSLLSRGRDRASMSVSREATPS